MKVDLHLPAGFRFHPTDEELVAHYLVRRCSSQPITVQIVAEIDLYKFDPWDLPDRALYGEKEWYFFSPRDRKYPNGSRPNRAAGCGYWKATGADKPIGKPKPIGIKKALVFYAGKAPKGDKTNWIMHEYRLADVDRSARKNSLRLDDWVLCRIYNKKGVIEKRHQMLPPQSPSSTLFPEESEEKKPQPHFTVPAYLTSPPAALQPACSPFNDYMHLDTSESAPKLHAESSSSEHVVSPELACEAQSMPAALKSDWEKYLGGFPGSYDDANATTDYGGTTSSQQQLGAEGDQMSPLQEFLMYLHKPF